MTKDEALRIIEEEHLNNYNFFEERSHKENELVIKQDENKWIIYKVNERESIVSGSKEIFDTESEALDNFIKRLRAGKLLEQLSDGKYH